MTDVKQTPDVVSINTLAQLINNNKYVHEALYNRNLTAYSNEQIEQLYLLAITHGIANVLNNKFHHALLSHNKEISNENLIKPLVSKLASFTGHSKVVTSITDNTAKTLLRALDKAKINVVVLKGFSLGYQVYSSPYLRPKTDVDILIQHNDKNEVLNVFEQLGYTNPRGWEPQAIINQFSMKKSLGKGINVLFDVHLKISNSKHIENILNHKELIESANSTLLPNINLINKQYALIHAIFHLLHHKSAGDLIKLIWFYDIYLIVEQLNKSELIQLKAIVKAKGLANLVLHTLNLTHAHFPSTKLSELINWNSTEDVMNTTQNTYNYLLENNYGIKGVAISLSATKGIKNKAAIIKEMVFPPSAEIYIKYGHQSGWPLPLLYVRRMITGLIKYTSSKKP